MKFCLFVCVDLTTLKHKVCSVCLCLPQDTRAIRQIIAKNRSGKVSFKEYFSVIRFLADSLRHQRMTGSNPTGDPDLQTLSHIIWLPHGPFCSDCIINC